ncbi:MAG: hypothetical protein FJW40_01375 [Acidobacteria bacterium]|nr:hypothetical protein [Acidobacteriota bacterium]
MSDNVSRRLFMATAPAAAAAQAQRAPVTATAPAAQSNRAPGEPIRMLTMINLDEPEIARITRAGGSTKVEITIARNRDEFRAKLRDAEVVYGDVRAQELDYAPRLKWMQAGGAGMEGTDPKLMASPIVITNFARTFAPAIAETAFGLLLCLTRGISTHYMPQFAKRQMNPVGSVKSRDYWELGGKTMGIVGMGGIGSEIARRAHYGFGMTVLATDARPMHRPDFVAELREPAWYREMAGKVDVLVGAAPHTRQTEKMFDEAVFRSMKKTAVFLAMSRGKLFDEVALVKALKEKWFWGAGLDVFPEEPPPQNHPIFDCPNVVMSAHTSGWGPERQERLISLLAENMRRYAGGLPLMNVVDKEKGY